MELEIPPDKISGGINHLYLLNQRIIGGCALSRISFNPVGA